jgi:hypothetical protein
MDLSTFQSFVQKNAEWFRGVHPESPASLLDAESRLGCMLPESLKWLLSEWGYSAPCGIGALNEAVDATMTSRAVIRLPHHYVIINDWGDGGVVYLDTQTGVIYWGDAADLHGIADGALPHSDSSTYEDYPAWVLSRLEVEKQET